MPYLPHSEAKDLKDIGFIFRVFIKLQTQAQTHLIMFSTPALAAALGTTNPDPRYVYVVVMAKKEAPVVKLVSGYHFRIV